MEKGYARCMMAPPSRGFPRYSISVEVFPVKRNEFSESPPFHSLPACLGSFRSALPFTVCALLSLTPRLSPSLGRFVTLPPPSIVRLLGVCTSCASGYSGLQSVRWRSRCPPFLRRCWGSNGKFRPLHHHPQARSSGIAGPALCLRLGLPTSNPEARGRGIRYKRDALEKWAGVTPRTIVCLSSLTSPIAFSVLIRVL